MGVIEIVNLNKNSPKSSIIVKELVVNTTRNT